MSLLGPFLGLLKILSTLVLIVAIAVSVRYRSTNTEYLTIRLLHSILSFKHYLILDRARPTLSAEYRAFEDVLRMQPLIGKDLLEDPITVVKKLRSNFDIGTIIPKPSQCQINKEVFEHDGHFVDTYWVDYSSRKLQTKSEKLLFYLHGGGYALGDIDSYGGIECHLSQLFNMSILHVEYRHTPEHSYPAAIDDTIAVYRALLQNNIPPSQLLFMGDSAGGGLALLTVQALLARELPVPRGVITISPWADLSISSESYTRNKKTDLIISADIVMWMTSQLLGPNLSQLPMYDPLISPLFGSFKGFPPLYVTVGTAEILEDDAIGVVNKAQDAGVDVTFEEGLHLVHAYPLFFPYFPEARNTLDNINKWIETIFTEQDTQ